MCQTNIYAEKDLQKKFVIYIYRLYFHDSLYYLFDHVKSNCFHVLIKHSMYVLNTVSGGMYI